MDPTPSDSNSPNQTFNPSTPLTESAKQATENNAVDNALVSSNAQPISIVENVDQLQENSQVVQSPVCDSILLGTLPTACLASPEPSNVNQSENLPQAAVPNPATVTAQEKAIVNKRSSIFSYAGRIQRDIVGFYKEPPPGIFISPDENDIKTIYALLVGPEGTPYEGGLFYFVMNFPETYPNYPPAVRLLTTGEGKVRFNPNLYQTGKVCLSILGTWSGPSWSPVLSLSSILISIQSLMNENPYHNEPGYEKERRKGDVKKFNDVVIHETLRVAVCGMLEGTTADSKNMPETLKIEMQKAFRKYYDYYMSTCEKNMNLSRKFFEDPFSNNTGRFGYDSLKTRLEALAALYPKEEKPAEPAQ